MPVSSDWVVDLDTIGELGRGLSVLLFDNRAMLIMTRIAHAAIKLS